MRVAVTGGSGRFGRVVNRHLACAGHHVVNIDRAHPEALPADLQHSVEPIRLDLTDLRALTTALEGCDAVIHLAAIPSPVHVPEPEVYANNTVASYNVLFAAASLGIARVCLASSINALGGVYSRKARYDYFPVDERHPTYNEDAYSLSKWVLEQQADSFARRHERMTIASLRVHGLHKLTTLRTREAWLQADEAMRRRASNHLWGYTDIDAAARACLATLLATFKGHEVFFITAPTTAYAEDLPSRELAREFYPDVPILGDLAGNASFYNCAKAERLLGWKHDAS